jgi:outer membrane protein assembly factor BamB
MMPHLFLSPAVFRLPLVIAGLLAGAACLDAAEQEPNWPQFRGVNGAGLALAGRIPAFFGPETNVLWKTAVPPGHSSPVIWNRRAFLTANEAGDKQGLLTLGVDRITGAVVWRSRVEAENPSGFHPLNNPASSTPAVDRDRVYAYFGTFGLVCYDHQGEEVWRRKLPTPPSKYGMATSPVLHGHKVILVLDGDQGESRLLALEQSTGQTVWEQPRPLFKAGWSTPMIFRHGDTEEVVVLGSKRLTAYDPATGEERWWAGGFPDETVGVPVAGEGLLFAGGAALGGRGDAALDAAATWKTTVEEFDRDQDGRIQREEMTAGFAFVQRPELPRDNPGYGLPVKDMDVLLRIFDHDKDRSVSESEWLATMAGFAAISHPTLAALRPGAVGDARPSHIAWEIQRGVPETPSILLTHGRLYLVRDGGVLTCLRAVDGKELFRERLGAPGQYIASPIAVGDRVVMASVPGVVTVVEVSDELKVVARNMMRERIFTTPAVVDNRLYLRTVDHLYAFGEVGGGEAAPANELE